LATLQVADEVEERLRKRINRGTVAVVVIVVLLGALGIYKFSDAMSKLDATSQAAVQLLDVNAKKDAASLVQRTNLLLGNIESQANSAESRLRQIDVREGGANRQLSIAEAGLKEYKVRFDALNQVPEQSPTTPIGALQSSLFTPITTLTTNSSLS
jgi:hypothetical protein